MGTKKSEYSQEFKDRAIELANEIGCSQAAEKLGLAGPKVIGSWKRWASRRSKFESTKSGKVEKPSYAELETRVLDLERRLREEKKVTEILKDATAFFSQDRLK